MAIHIHIHKKTKDADGPAHAPAGSSKGGQFVSGSGGGGAAPKHSPMKQANRNLEAAQLKESRKIAKQGTSPGVNPGIRQMQAKADVEEAKKRIAAKKKPAPTEAKSEHAGVHKMVATHVALAKEDGDDDHANLIHSALTKAKAGQPLSRQEHTELHGLLSQFKNQESSPRSKEQIENFQSSLKSS